MPSSSFHNNTMNTDEVDWMPVFDLKQTPFSKTLAVQVAGEDVIIFRCGGGYVAMDRWCPHRRGDLVFGRVTGNAMKCTLHGFMFSAESGHGLNCPGFNVRVHELRVEDGVISVRLRRRNEEQA